METNNHSVNVREAGSNDCSLLSALIRSAFLTVAQRFGLDSTNCPTHPSNCTAEWIDRDLIKGTRYYVLESNGTPAGCVALEKANADQCFLERLAVLPHQRNKGFGKMLVDTALLEAQVCGVKNVSIGIIADDIELKEWYRKMGFIEGETRKLHHLPFAVTFMSYDLK